MAISANHTKFEYPDYISPLPAEDLIKVALYKQQMFDEGVTQVQSQIDAYSELRNQIYTPIEQQYFDETMTSMVKAVNDSAGLDFSKKANVQSVLGIGKPLEKDRNIINAVKNGRIIQKRQKTLSELDSSKRSATNDWFYTKDVNDYLSANKLGISLQDKEYDEFYDISEKVFDFVKTLSKEEQNEFYTVGEGTPTGYIEKITQQGFNTTQLANKVKGMLSTDPKAARQLQIDTEYYYNALGPQRAYQSYIEDQTTKMVAIDESLTNAKEQLAILEASNARVKSPSVQKEIDAAKQNVQVLSQYYLGAKQNSSKKFEEFNPNDYFETYQNQFVTNLANLYTTQKVSRDLKDDKVWDVVQKQNLEVLKNNLDIEKEKVKARLESAKPENLLKKKETLWNMGNVSTQDLIVIPQVLSDPTVNMDIDKFVLGDVIAGKEATRVAPTNQKQAVVQFFKFLNKGIINEDVEEAIDALQNKSDLTSVQIKDYEKTLNQYTSQLANRTFVVNFKDGDTQMATGNDLLSIPISSLKNIESLAQTNTIETFSGRKRKSDES